MKHHKVRDAIVGIMNNRARVLEPDGPWTLVKLRTCEREPRTVTIGMEETNSPLSMWLQLGRACQAFVFVAGDFGHSPESAQHQRAKARGTERRAVKAALDFRFKGKGESFKGGWGWYGKSWFTDKRT